MTTTLAKPATPNQFGKRRIDAKCPGRDSEIWTTERLGRRIADSDNPLIFKPDWSQGQITGKHGQGTLAPAPNKGMLTVPNGLSVGTDDTPPGTDTIGGVDRSDRSANRNRIDLYRYRTKKDADAATRRVPVIVYIPDGSKAKCPR